MILSNREIHAALDAGLLSIAPEPAPRQPDDDGECPYATSAVDLTLGREVSWLKKGMPISIDLRHGKFRELFTEGNSERREITEEQGYLLQPHQFVLGKTAEYIRLPIVPDQPCLAARVEGKSSYARCGLLVHFTAPTIHSGFEGTITLEMMNFGDYAIALHPGLPICQLIIEKVDGQPLPRQSQFQGQTTPGGR